MTQSNVQGAVYGLLNALITRRADAQTRHIDNRQSRGGYTRRTARNIFF